MHSGVTEKRGNDRACVFSARASNYLRQTRPPARVKLGTRIDLQTTSKSFTLLTHQNCKSHRLIAPIYRQRIPESHRGEQAPIAGLSTLVCTACAVIPLKSLPKCRV